MSAHFPLHRSARSYVVTAAHGRQLRVRDADGVECAARPARRDLLAVCGDQVDCEFDPLHGELRVVTLLERVSALYRSNARGQGELVAANLGCLLVVAAPLPRPDWFVTDRYLAAARCAGIDACVLLNKCELPLADDDAQQLHNYARIGYRCLHVSAHTSPALAALRAALHATRAMLVGQSGVGKTSLLRALAPDSDAAVGELIRDDEGRHTTTASRLYTLPDGGELIDSPGVRDFAPPVDRLEPRALGFVEVDALSSQCRFADCRHMQEPGCAVRDAIDARRYESYRRLRRLYEQLKARRFP